MPILLAEGLTISIPLVKEHKKHRDYQRVVDLAKKYYRPLITGAELDSLLKKFVKREDDASFSQRREITQHITPAICHTLITPVRKLPKIRPSVKRMEYGNEQGNAKTTTGTKGSLNKLESITSTFWKGMSVETYMAQRLLDLSMVDPNAFIVLTHDTFNNRLEAPKVYPVEVSSDQAWNYEFFNGELQWLLVGIDIEYETGTYTEIEGVKKAVMAKGRQYTFYIDNHHIRYRQVRKTLIPFATENMLMLPTGEPVTNEAATSTPQGEVVYYLRTSKEELYEVTIFEQDTNEVQAFRVGYMADLQTDGRTCVSFLEPARPYLMKSIKAVSELDLTSALHAIPQKLQYMRVCGGYKGAGCQEGYEFGSTDRKCKQCGGTGWDTITSAQDHITLRMPQHKDEFLELDKMVVYKAPPVDLLTWQVQYVKDLKTDSYKALYNTDLFAKEDLAQTATAKLADMDNAYDAMQPICGAWAYWWKKVNRMLAVFNGLESGLMLEFHFPSQYKMQSISEVLGVMKAAKESDVSQGIRAQLNADLAVLINSDDPVAQVRAVVMTEWDPFAGKSEQAVLSIMANPGSSTDENVFMWSNLSVIFNVAEQRARDQNTDLYKLDPEKRRKLIIEVRDEMMESIGDTQDPSLEFPARTGVEPDQPDAPAQPTDRIESPTGGVPTDAVVQDTALNGSQIATLVDIMKSIRVGDLSKETAKPLILAAFPGIPDGLVTTMINGVKEAPKEAAPSPAQPPPPAQRPPVQPE